MARAIRKLGKYEELHSVVSASERLIFVHGFGGHYQKTWGQLPCLMAEDSGFDHTDFHFLGYDSGVGKFLVADIASLAQRLITILLHECSQDTVRIIAHSMGGLIVKEAVAEVLSYGKAQELSRLRHVVFCSTPHLGVVKANFFQFMGKHVKELKALGPAILKSHSIWMSRVVQRIPRLEEDITHERYSLSVIITNVWATNDKMVTFGNATALTADRDLTLPGDHSSIVKPRSDKDQVYVDLTGALSLPLIPREKSPSSRMIETSASLQDPILAVGSTLDLPDKYERLCSAYQGSRRPK